MHQDQSSYVGTHLLKRLIPPALPKPRLNAGTHSESSLSLVCPNNMCIYILERANCNEKKNGLALIFLSRCLNSRLLAALKSSHGNKLKAVKRTQLTEQNWRSQLSSNSKIKPESKEATQTSDVHRNTINKGRQIIPQTDPRSFFFFNYPAILKCQQLASSLQSH